MIYTSIHRYKFGIRADATAGGRDANGGRLSFRRKLHSLPFTSFGDGSLTRLSASPSASLPPNSSFVKSLTADETVEPIPAD